MMKLNIRLQNGEEIQATTAEWLAAIISEMRPEAQARVFERMRRSKSYFTTPGSYVIQAEGGVIGAGRE